MHKELAIGVDLGATKIATALVSSTGEVLDSRQSPTAAHLGPSAVCDRIASEVRDLLKMSAGDVLGVGIGSPGLIEHSSIVRNAINLKWDEVDLGLEISRRLDRITVSVENDANANVLGEGYFGSAQGFDHYVLLTIGSGLGSGAVSHGKLITGTTGFACNLGHYSIDPDNGRPCVCGNRGCAETIASGSGLVAVMRSLRDDPAEPTTDRILAAARSGDPIALDAFAEMAKVVGHVAAIAAAVLDPQVIVIGGGLGVAAFDLIDKAVTAEMARRLSAPQVPPPLRAATLVSPAVGAAALVWERTIGKPPANRRTDPDPTAGAKPCP